MSARHHAVAPLEVGHLLVDLAERRGIDRFEEREVGGRRPALARLEKMHEVGGAVVVDPRLVHEPIGAQLGDERLLRGRALVAEQVDQRRTRVVEPEDHRHDSIFVHLFYLCQGAHLM